MCDCSVFYSYIFDEFDKLVYYKSIDCCFYELLCGAKAVSQPNKIEVAYKINYK
jgi:hypothetical protein